MGKGFRILDFSLKNFMGDRLSINFFNTNQQIDTNLFSSYSLIIGENGCGKTEFLVRLLMVFIELEELVHGDKLIELGKGTRYLLKYSLDGHIYEIENEKRFLLKKDGQIIYNISSIELPNSFLAQSFSFADKFIFGSEGRYSYLGTRTASNVSYTSHIENSIVKIICNKIGNIDSIEFLKELLDFLSFNQKLDILFKIRLMKKLTNLINDLSFFKKLCDEIVNSNKRMDSDILSLLNNVHVEEIHRNICNLVQKYRGPGKAINYTLNLNIGETFKDIQDFFVYLRLLSYMRILSTPEAIFYKDDTQFSINSASSGEKQIVYSLLNIYSAIKPNSLVIIDEPEISLHPNWQMKYIKLLEKIFYKYNSHFIIATHSHFMVSDLRKENSSIIVMTKSLKDFNAKTYKSDTYGWSAEDILYNVFGVPSSRNYYIASDVEEVLQAIYSENVTEEIIEKIKNLKKVLPNIKEVDPLKTIISKILERNPV